MFSNLAYPRPAMLMMQNNGANLKRYLNECFSKNILSDLNSFVGLVGTFVSLSIYILIIGVFYFFNLNPDEAF